MNLNTIFLTIAIDKAVNGENICALVFWSSALLFHSGYKAMVRNIFFTYTYRANIVFTLVFVKIYQLLFGNDY